MTCDKCNEHVEKQHDITHLEAIRSGKAFTVLAYASRHIWCSPSRSQYIMIEPYGKVDERVEYSKLNMPGDECASLEESYTDAYAELVKEVTDELST